MMKNKKAEKNGLIWIGLVLVVLYLAGFFGGSTSQSAGGSAGGSSASNENVGSVVKVVGAPCTQATTLTTSVVRRYTEVAQTTENATILQNGVLKGTIAHAGTTTVQSGANGDMLDIYPGFQSTTFYTQHVNGKIETCTGSATTGDPAFKVVKDTSVGGNGVSYTEPNKIIQIDTAPTITVQNDDPIASNEGGQGSSTGSNLSIGQGASNSVTVTIRPTYNTGIGAIGGNILACQFPSAVYDATNPLVVSKGDGTQLEASSVVPSSTNFALIGANNTVKAWKMDGIDGRAVTKYVLGITAKADSNHNPSGALDRVNCTVFDTNYYQRQSDGKYVMDIENRDTNVDLGGANTNFDFTIGVA